MKKSFLKNIFVLITFVSFFTLPTVLLGIGLDKNLIDKPTKGKYVAYSTKKGNENLVEIFSDGLQYKYLQNVIDNTNIFKDFAIIKKYATFGENTDSTFATLFGNYKKYNYFNFVKAENVKSYKQYRKMMYERGFAKIGVEHLNDLDKMKIDFAKTIINPVNFARDVSTSANAVGDPQSIYNLDKNINVVNWAQARDNMVNNGWGIKKVSASNASYNFLTYAKHSKKPARVLFNDMISHGRYISGRNYKFERNDINTTYKNHGDYLQKYFNALKNLKTKDGNAYDNSLIIIYGDHANHDTFKYKKNELKTMKKQDYKRNSILLIKYPHYTNNKPTYLDNTVVYSPFIKKIIQDYFKNKNNYNVNPLHFLQTNKNFQNNKLMLNNEGYEMQFNNSNKLMWTLQVLNKDESMINQKQKILSYGMWKE